MRRGDVHIVDLEPVRGSEANKRRPAIIVSNDAANSVARTLGRGVVTVVPLTSRTGSGFPFHVAVAAEDSGLHDDSTAQAEQVRSVAIEHIGPRTGSLPLQVMAQLEAALRVHLDLPGT